VRKFSGATCHLDGTNRIRGYEDREFVSSKRCDRELDSLPSFHATNPPRFPFDSTENNNRSLLMRMKFLAGALAAATALSAVALPAQARPWHHRHHGGGAAVGGFLAGALIGGALASAANSNRYYAPGYAYAPTPGYAYAPGYGDSEVAYCASRYRSYDPASGTYLGYDGARHPCP
jgi:hypothetical protein